MHTLGPLTEGAGTAIAVTGGVSYQLKRHSLRPFGAPPSEREARKQHFAFCIYFSFSLKRKVVL